MNNKLKLIPEWETENSGAWNFYFHWLWFCVFSMNSPSLGIDFDLSCDGIGIQFRITYVYFRIYFSFPEKIAKWIYKVTFRRSFFKNPWIVDKGIRDLVKSIDGLKSIDWLMNVPEQQGEDNMTPTAPNDQALSVPEDNTLFEIRQAFADYRNAEGGECCRDRAAHKKAETRLAELLKPKPYDDGSGWDWNRYTSK